MKLLLHGGPIYAPSVPGAGAMLVVDATIAWIGPAAGAEQHRDSADAVVDLDGALVAPAFVDAHVHHTATGMTLLGLDLRGVASRQALLDVLSAEARRLRGRPIIGHGWDETLWADPTLPTREELDRATWGSVVYLSRVDVHSGLVSSALIALVPDVRSARGFEDSGRVTAHAHHLVRQHVTEQMPGGLRAAAQRATREHAAAAGVAALHEAGGPDINGADDLVALIELARSSAGPDLVAYWGQAGGPSAALDLGAVGAAGDLFIDGALGSHTAWLRAPYADDPGTCGNRYLEPDVVTEHLIACTRAGVQAGFHAIGDAALDIVVDGLRVAIDTCGQGAVRGSRHRIEHLTMAGPEHAAVLADAGVVASVQPLFDAHWGAADGAYAARLGDRSLCGPARLRRAGPCRGVPGAGLRQPRDRHRAVGVGPGCDVAPQPGGAAQRPGGLRRGDAWRLAGRPSRRCGRAGGRGPGHLRRLGRGGARGPDPGCPRGQLEHGSALWDAGASAAGTGGPCAQVPGHGADGRTIHVAQDSSAGEGLPDSGSVAP